MNIQDREIVKSKLYNRLTEEEIQERNRLISENGSQPETSILRLLFRDELINSQEAMDTQRGQYPDVYFVNDPNDLSISTDGYKRLGSLAVSAWECLPIDTALSRIGSNEIDITRPSILMWDLTDDFTIDEIESRFIGVQIIVCPMDRFRSYLSDNMKAEEIKIYTNTLNIEDRGNTEAVFTAGSIQKSILQTVLQDGYTRRASDIHFDPIGNSFKVRYRIDGDLVNGPELQLGYSKLFYNLLKETAQISTQTSTEPAKGQMVAELVDSEGKSDKVSIRINMLAIGEYYSINVRFIPNAIPLLRQTLAEEMYKKILEITQMSKGLVLVVGPTGSGKSTLIYQILEAIAAMSKCVLTVEDPVEVRLPGVTQVNVDNKNGVGWDDYLESFLRHDPDTILLGEIRNFDIAKRALSTAETGHLVFSTLHTNDAISTVNRLRYFGLDSQSVADTLKVVVSQRLVKRVCEHCKTEYDLPPTHHWREEYSLGEGEVKLFKGKGCTHCGGTGYKGRLSINEILISNRQFRELVINDASTDEIRDVLYKQGFKTLLQDGIVKALMGLTTLEQLDKYRKDIE